VTLFFSGDSNINGMGARGRSFREQLTRDAAARGTSTVDLSAPGRTLTQTIPLLPSPDGTPEVWVLQHGLTDVMLRPDPAVVDRLPLPRRYRRPGWLDPRPWYSSALSRRLWQRLENQARWRLKLVLLRRHPFAYADPAEFSREQRDFVAHLLQVRSASRVYVLELHPTAERYFPGTAARYTEVNAGLDALAEEFPAVRVVRYAGALDLTADYLLDGLHLSQSGQAKIYDRLQPLD